MRIPAANKYHTTHVIRTQAFVHYTPISQHEAAGEQGAEEVGLGRTWPASSRARTLRASARGVDRINLSQLDLSAEPSL